MRALHQKSADEPSSEGRAIPRRSMIVGTVAVLAGAAFALSAYPAFAGNPTGGTVAHLRGEEPPSQHIVELPPPADVKPGVPMFSAHVLR